MSPAYTHFSLTIASVGSRADRAHTDSSDSVTEGANGCVPCHCVFHIRAAVHIRAVLRSRVLAMHIDAISAFFTAYGCKMTGYVVECCGAARASGSISCTMAFRVEGRHRSSSTPALVIFRNLSGTRLAQSGGIICWSACTDTIQQANQEETALCQRISRQRLACKYVSQPSWIPVGRNPAGQMYQWPWSSTCTVLCTFQAGLGPDKIRTPAISYPGCSAEMKGCWSCYRPCWWMCGGTS